MSMNKADTRYHLIEPVLRDKGYVSRERITLETVLTAAPIEGKPRLSPYPTVAATDRAPAIRCRRIRSRSAAGHISSRPATPPPICAAPQIR